MQLRYESPENPGADLDRGHWDVVHPIRRDWLSGMNFRQLAQKYQIDPRTAKRYAVQNLPLEQLGSRSRSMLDPYRSQIESWLQEDGIYITTIQRRLKRCGMQCGYMTVCDYVDKIRANR